MVTSEIIIFAPLLELMSPFQSCRLPCRDFKSAALL
jgi:hypothetical protein